MVEKIENINIKNAINVFAVTIVLLSVVISLCIYGLNERRLMAANMENAMAKGIDPLSVRCSYAKGDDIICVTYAASCVRVQEEKTKGRNKK